MKKICVTAGSLAFVLLLLSTTTLRADEQPHEPLQLHPDNPHYFLFRGKPTIIVTSAEHYGAVLNRKFDYQKYLDELAAHGLNNTRVFSGAYCEPQGAFNIAKNTLAPAEGDLICPWARSDQGGYTGGGNRFDLSRWDEEYFRRLKDFVAQAGQRGVIVEMTLFCPFYEEPQWNLCPMNAINNINGLGQVGRTDVYTLDKHGGLLAVHEALVKKIVRELNEFDNLYFEICNEPYFGGATLPWQHHIADVIAATEKNLPNQHLISQNVANGSAKIQDPHPAISIFNFHYASPPVAVGENYRLQKVIGDNETGFKGTADTHYRMEAWEFLLAGGALFNHLDYSFAVGHEDGTFQYPDTQPGGGNRGFRRQMSTVTRFIGSFDFVRIKPDTSFIKAGLPQNARAQALVEPGKQYAMYIHGSGEARLRLSVPDGEYRVAWLNPKTGRKQDGGRVRSADETLTLPAIKFATEVAIELRRIN